MNRIRKLLAALIAAAMVMSLVPLVFADNLLTADEAERLLNEHCLASKDYCEEVMNMPVYNEDNIFENKTVRDYGVDPEKTYVDYFHDISYSRKYYGADYVDGIDSIALCAIIGDKLCNINFSSMVPLNDTYYVSIHNNGSAEYRPSYDEPRDDNVSYSAVVDGMVDYAVINEFKDRKVSETYPYNYISTGNYQAVADFINNYGLRDITMMIPHIRSITVKTAENKYYYARDDKCVEFSIEDTVDTEYSDKYESLFLKYLEKKYAATPEEYKKYIQSPEDYKKMREDGVYMYYNAPDTDSLAEYVGQSPIYSDLGGDEFLAQATHLLSDKGIVTGFDDGTFRPNSTLTRAEAAMMLRPLVKGDYASKNFPDTEKHWARDAIGYLAGAKVINGFEDGLFRPDDNLTYSQAIQLVYSIMGMNCDFYCENKTRRMMGLGFFKGVDSFTDTDMISRGNFAKILANAFDISLIVDEATFTHQAPSFSWVSDITLATYLDGGEVKNGELFVSYDDCYNWEENLKKEYDRLYSDIDKEFTNEVANLG